MNLQFVMTCAACPEQYDLIADGDPTQRVAYFRIRHGRFRVECPDVGGLVVYEHTWPHDPDKGGFDTSEERLEYMRRALTALYEWWVEDAVSELLAATDFEKLQDDWLEMSTGEYPKELRIFTIGIANQQVSGGDR